jgi:large subunit ribosomal protein L24
MARIRKDDMVEVISGNDRGKRGKVLRVIPDKNRLVVQGINLRWKHLRKSQQHPQGGRVRREVPIHMSNVMIHDDAAGRTRVGFQVVDGKKVRIARKTGAPLGAAPAAPKARKPKKAAKSAGAAAAKSAEAKE